MLHRAQASGVSSQPSFSKRVRPVIAVSVPPAQAGRDWAAVFEGTMDPSLDPAFSSVLKKFIGEQDWGQCLQDYEYMSEDIAVIFEKRPSERTEKEQRSLSDYEHRVEAVTSLRVYLAEKNLY